MIYPRFKYNTISKIFTVCNYFLKQWEFKIMDKPNKNDENCQAGPIHINFDEIFTQSSIGILLYDKKGNLTNANDSAIKIARIPKLDDVLGTNIFDNPKIASKKEELHEKGLIKFQYSLNLIKIKDQNIYNPIELKIIDIDWTVSVTDSGYLVQIQDITQQKKVDDKNKSLLDSVQADRDMLSALINNIPDEVWFADKNKKFTIVNPTALREFGLYSKDIDIEKLASNLEVYRPDGSSRPLDEAPPLRALKGEHIRNMEEIVRNPTSNELRYRQVNASPVKDKNDKIIGAVSVVRDITESKKVIQSLKESQKEYSNLFERMNEGFTIAEMIYNDEGKPYDFRWIDMNHAYEKIIGFTRETLLKTTARAMFPELQPKLIENFGKVMLTGKQLEFENYNIDLDTWFHVIAYKITQKYFAFLTLDITERKKTEKLNQKLLENEQQLTEELKVTNEELIKQGDKLLKINNTLLESEESFRSIIENIQDSYMRADKDGTIVMASPSAARMYRFDSHKGMIGTSTHSYFKNSEDSDYAIGELKKHGKFINYEVEARRNDGTFFWVSQNAQYYFDGQGKILGSETFVRDITENIKNEHELKESEEKYRNIVEIANEGIMIADTTGRINFLNAKMAQMLGYSIEELLGINAESLVDKDDYELGLQKIENRRKGIQESYEIKYIRKSGEGLWCLISATPMYDYGGKHIGNMTMQTDITERKKSNDALQESESRFHSVLDNSQDVIYRVNVQTGKYEYVSPSTKKVFGYSPEELMALAVKNPLNTIHPDDRIKFQIGINKLEQDDKVEMEYRHKTINGKYCWISNKMGLIRDNTGKPLYRDGNMRDITKRKRIEEQMKIAMDELRRSNEELERFAYVSSHDLQEPLRMVKLYSQLLERRYKDNLDSDADDFIEYIVEGANRMKQLIDDLLEYSRVTSQAKEFDNIDLQKVLDIVLRNLSISIIENNVTISHDPFPTIFADQNQMLQVFQNLITNAIKFHGQNPPKINISVQKDEKEWIFSVSDNGIGIDSKHQNQIFEVFKRLHHNRDEYPGSGIGLSITQKIIIHHGGRIWVESEIGKGTTFYFTIPKVSSII